MFFEDRSQSVVGTPLPKPLLKFSTSLQDWKVPMLLQCLLLDHVLFNCWVDSTFSSRVFPFVQHLSPICQIPVDDTVYSIAVDVLVAW